jgi:putative Ca2+/H+ antiporter (TMEM165/GDT1 family)
MSGDGDAPQSMVPAMVFAQLLVAATLEQRLSVSGVTIVAGIVFILVGRSNVRSRIAHETGGRRWVNMLLDNSNTYTGDKAVWQGKIRIYGGIGFLLFGIGYLIWTLIREVR